MNDSDDKLKALEKRLDRIEKYLDMPPERPAKATETSTIEKTPVVTETTTRLETSFRSGGWLGILAIICFVLAAGFIVKLSIDSGLLSPINRIGLSALLGFTLIGCGLYFLKLDREYISLLPASGIIVFYLTTFAAYRLYALIPFEAAVITSGVVSFLCVSLYLRIKHSVYPLTAVFGAYLAPVVLSLNPQAIFTLYYFLICSLAFAILSILVKSRVLAIVAAYLAFILTAQIGDHLDQNYLVSQILVTQFFIFSFATYFYTRHHQQPLTENEAWMVFPVLLIFYMAEYYFLGRINHDLAAWASLAFAAFLILLYYMQKTFAPTHQTASEGMLFAFVAIVVAHAGYYELLPNDAKSWVLVVMVAGLALLPERFIGVGKNKSFFIPLLIAAAIATFEYGNMAYDLFNDEPVSWPVIWAAVASIWWLFVSKSQAFDKDNSYGYALLGAAHLIVILATHRLADPYGSLAVSAIWLFYAIVVIVLAFYRKDKVMANSALLVLGFSAGKALLYDAASAPTIVRILCLLLTGLVLYCAGLLFRRISKWK